MTDSIPLSDLRGAKAFKFTDLGDHVAGRIVRIDLRDQTDLDGNVVTWADGKPRPQYVITLALADGSETAIYARGGNYETVEGEGTSMLVAITDAVKAAGAESIDAGAELAVAYTGRGKPTKAGRDAPKLYRAQYRPPAPAHSSVNVADMFTT